MLLDILRRLNLTKKRADKVAKERDWRPQILPTLKFESHLLKSPWTMSKSSPKLGLD